MFVKLTAIGFIYMILLGNLWLAYAVIGHEPGAWFQPFSQAGLAFTVISILLMGLSRLKRDSEPEL